MFSAGKTFKWLFGVQPSFLLGAKYKAEYTGWPAIETENKDLFKGMDIGIITGLEYALESGLNFGFRFAYGVTPVYESSLYPKLHNLNLQFTVGYTLGSK